jgi:hypothetical protein
LESTADRLGRTWLGRLDFAHCDSAREGSRGNARVRRAVYSGLDGWSVAPAHSAGWIAFSSLRATTGSLTAAYLCGAIKSKSRSCGAGRWREALLRACAHPVSVTAEVEFTAS